ncbi:MAG: hypothetical protein R3Y21_01585 [Mycoplasmatota bacterium]
MINVLFVTIILVIMIIITLFLIKDASKRINQDAKMFYLNELQVFDSVITEKEEKIERLNKELKELEDKNKGNTKISNDSSKNLKYSNVETPDFEEKNFYENMKFVRENFEFNEIKVITEIINKHYDIILEKKYELLNYIDEILDGETLYDLETLSTMNEKEKIDFLKSNLDVEFYEIFDNYLQQEKISIGNFKKYITNQKLKSDPFIYIETSDLTKDYTKIHKNVKLIHNTNIFSGIIINYKNKTYDYSVRGDL